MTFVVYATPPVPPPPLPNPWPGMRHEFTDWLGRTWDLSNWTAGTPFLVAGEVRGLHFPEVEDFVDVAAGVDGQSLRGFRVNARDCFWPIAVYSDASSTQWLERDADWWDGLEPGRVGLWSVTTPAGTVRTLPVRAVPDGDGSFERDPAAAGWQVYGVRLVADEPYWTGTPIERTFTAAEPTPFTGPDDEAPPFFVSGGATTSDASIENPGQVAAWPVWRAEGPHTGLTVGVGSTVIEVPDLAEGETFQIDTSPWSRIATVDGVDVTADLGDGTDFAPVPARGTQTLSVLTEGDGTVSCTITPRYYRAW